MEVVSGEVLGFQLPHLAVGDLDALFVGGVVEFGVHGEAGAGGGAGDQVDDDFVAGQRLASNATSARAKACAAMMDSHSRWSAASSAASGRR